MKTIRWGIIGLGNIAHKFAADLALVANCKLQAVASSDETRAQQFAEKFKANNCYSNYDALLEDNQIDIVYVASLHPLHASLSVKALEKGKAVVCEKPLGMHSSEVKQIMGAAKKSNTFLMEALWTRFNPAFEQVREWIHKGQIGELRYINATFSFNGLDRGKASRLFNPEKGGGSLLDIGIYPLFLAYHFLGKPKDVKASAILSAEGVDEQLSFILSYDNAQALLYSSFVHDEDMRASLCGETGEIYMDSKWHATSNVNLVKAGKEIKKSFPFNGMGYTYEIEEANTCLRWGKLQSPKWKWEESLDMAILMDEIRKQVGVSYPADEQSLKK